MVREKKRSRYGRQVYKLKKLRALAVLFFSITAIIVLVYLISNISARSGNERRDIIRIWNSGDYIQTYTISKSLLEIKPMDYFMLTINGFSAYQLGISQINTYDKLFYINECIISLRKALIQKKSSDDGRVCYVLGKAYYYKGPEYSDLAVKYLEMANDYSYDARDIPEYLGLAYAAASDYKKSVEAFTRAIIPDKPLSDTLLLSIARSYMAMYEYDMASSYLLHCIDTSTDSKSIIIAHFLLAEIYINTNDYDKAENQYISILDKSGESAEVRYQLGELYNLKGDTTRARAEWRMAFRQDPAHTKARARLNI
jgi:tetratricopeptide (TPR) repeat protein